MSPGLTSPGDACLDGSVSAALHMSTLDRERVCVMILESPNQCWRDGEFANVESVNKGARR